MRNRFSARRMIAVAGVAAGLAVGGGVAYAAGGDPTPQQPQYGTIVDEPTPSPGQGQDGRDCPEKDGSQSQGSGDSGDTAQEQA